VIIGVQIRVKGSVGSQYAAFLKAHAPSVELNEEAASLAFREEFSRASKQHPCFGATQGMSSEEWWRQVSCLPHIKNFLKKRIA
jgi:hypothetical protein